MQKGKFHAFLSCLMNCILLLLVFVLGVKDEQENICLKGVDKACSYRLCVHTSGWESPGGALWSWGWKEKQPLIQKIFINIISLILVISMADSHFTHGKTEAQGGQVAHPGSHGSMRNPDKASGRQEWACRARQPPMPVCGKQILWLVPVSQCLRKERGRCA